MSSLCSLDPDTGVLNSIGIAVHVEKHYYFINIAKLQMYLNSFYALLKSNPVIHNVNSFLTYMYLELRQETVFLLPELEERTKSISLLYSILIKRTEPLTIFTFIFNY